MPVLDLYETQRYMQVVPEVQAMRLKRLPVQRQGVLTG